MVPEGPPAPLGGGQPVVPSMLRANSGLLGGHGGSLPSQNAFPSLVSPRDQFSSMHMIESVPNVSSLLHQSFANGAPSFNLSYGSSQMGLIDGGAESGPLSRVGNGTGFNQPYSSFMSSPTALNPNSSSQVQAQQQFSNLTDQQQAQQQQQQHLLQSRKPSGAAAAAQILHQQRFMQIQPQKLLKSMPQQRSPLQPQFQLQNMLVRSPVRPVYEPGMCARRLTQYMYQQQHRPEDNNIEFWRRFVAEYFAPSAKKKWCVSMYGSGRPTTGVSAKDVWHCQICNCKPGRGLEATAEVLPRLFKIKYESGTLEELLYVDTPREYHNFSGQIVLDYAKAIQESVFGQVRVVRDGQLRIVFSQDLKICSWEFCARRHEELIPRRLLIPQVNQHGAPSSTPGSEQQNNCNMFVASACQLAKAQEVPVVNDFGYTKRYMRCLQISQVVNSMKDLMDYGSETGTGPRESLAKFLHRIKPEFQNKPQQKESQLQQQQQQQQQQQIMVQNTSNPAQAAANNPYGGNSMQMPPPDSSSTLPQTQPTISPFQSATPPSSHNPLPAPDGGLSGALVNQQEYLGNQLLLDGLWTVDGLYDLLFEGESSA